MSTRQINNFFVLFAIVNLFFIVSFFHIVDRGLLGDEAQIGTLGINVLKGTAIDETGMTIQLKGLRLPINFAQPYSYALLEYLLVPFFYVFGITLISLRLPSVIFSGLSLFCIYFILIKLFNRRVALITVFLLAIDSVFIFDSIDGAITTEPILNAFFFVNISLFILYRERKKNIFLYLSVFIFALGFSLKLTMLWRVLGLLIAFLTVFGKSVALGGIKKIFLSPKKIVLCLIITCLGSSLCLVYNLNTKFKVFHEATKALSTTSYGEHKINNLNFSGNLQLRVSQFFSMLSSEDILYIRIDPQNINSALWGNIRKVRCLIFLVVFIFGLVIMPVYKFRRWLSFCYVFFITVFICSCFSLYTFRTIHLISLLPFIFLFIACLIDSIITHCHHACYHKDLEYLCKALVFCLIFLPFTASSLFELFFLSSILKNKDTFGTQSVCFFKVAEYIQKLRNKTLVVFDDGNTNVLPFLTQGAIIPFYIYTNSYNPDECGRQLTSFILAKNENKSLFLLFRATNSNGAWALQADYLSKIQGISEANKWNMRIEKEFTNKEGVPIYTLYRLSL